MKKLGFLTAAIWVISLMMMPSNSFAKMTVMADNELRQVTGQAGIMIKPEDVIELGMTAESLSYTDIDGSGPYFAMADTILEGSVSASSIDYDFINQSTSDGTEIQGLSMTFNDVEINIDHFQTDMRLGDKNGSDSLGVFGIMGLKTRISGNVRIYTRQ